MILKTNVGICTIKYFIRKDGNLLTINFHFCFMLRLLLIRLYVKNKNTLKTLMVYTFVITVTLCFSSLLLVIYNNHLSPYRDSGYNYLLTNFDEDNIEELNKCSDIEGVYPIRTVSANIRMGDKVQTIDLNCVDEWDTQGISYYSASRSVAGEFTKNDNGIVLDVLLARKINADIGDTVYVSIGNNEVEYIVCMLIEPLISGGYGQVVCLYNDYMKNSGMGDLEYSLLFVKALNGDIDDYFDNYEGSFIKKAGEVDDVESELAHTPPITIGVFILGVIVIFLFILKECTSQREDINKKIAILVALGQKSNIVIKLIVAGQMLLLIPAIFISGVLTKTIYNVLISNYYLSLGLLVMELVIVLLFTFVVCVVVGIIMYKSYKKKQVYDLLRGE